jgi:hypothetical protein
MKRRLIFGAVGASYSEIQNPARKIDGDVKPLFSDMNIVGGISGFEKGSPKTAAGARPKTYLITKTRRELKDKYNESKIDLAISQRHFCTMD